jgi:REP element-mobilizing transposase RayT
MDLAMMGRTTMSKGVTPEAESGKNGDGSSHGLGGHAQAIYRERRRVGTRRWLAPWKDSRTTPVLYHVISRVVDRRLAFHREEKEHFRKLMRMYETFSGCRVLAYAVMGNHFHLLLEVPPRPEAGLDAGTLDRKVFAERLAGIYKAGVVAEILKTLDAALAATDGSEASRVRVTEEIAGPYLVRMHDLSEFMNGVLKRFTRWFNRQHTRTGTLWEERFKSVIVENGIPARTVAAYIDLNPVRAGLAADPADYRWSSYGEAVGAGARSVAGKAARGGLVRALLCSDGVKDEPERWGEVSGRYRLLLRQAMERKGRSVAVRQGNEIGAAAGPMVAEFDDKPKDEDGDGSTKVAGPFGFVAEMGFAGMLMCRVRYFTSGAVIGSRETVESCFEQARYRFGPKRKTGARRIRGTAENASGVIWAARDTRDGQSTSG